MTPEQLAKLEQKTRNKDLMQMKHVDWIGRAERTSSRSAFKSKLVTFALHTYQFFVEMLVYAPEQARMVLPQNYDDTEWYWTGSLYLRFLECVISVVKPDTQEETRNVAWEIHDLAKEKFPVSWEALFYANI